MPSKDITALELFKEYYPRFRKIMWVPCGFAKHDCSARYDFLPDREASFTWYACHSLDVRIARLAFTHTYDPDNRLDPRSQWMGAMWDAILAGPFAGRVFHADPDVRYLKPSWRDETGFAREIPILFSIEGKPINGLDFREDMVADSWRFFIPPGSPEAKAINVALAFEERVRQSIRHKEAQKNLPTIAELAEQLRSSIAAVPA